VLVQFLEQVPTRRSSERPVGSGRDPLHGWGRVSGSPLALWWGVSLALAVLSALVWPTVPSYDPWSWVVWGREVTDPHISFFIGGGPSWKPLPFLFTTIYGPLGGIAPTLWVITARTGGIAGLIGAVRLASLLCSRVGLPRTAAAVAGLFAAVGIVLGPTDSLWTYYFFRGTSETLLIGVWLWALDRMLAGRHWQAYMLISAEGLMRPEAWPFLGLYGLWLCWREPGMRVWVLLGWVAQPVGWFVPPWISTGEPLLAATHAAEYNGGLGSEWLKSVVLRGVGLQPLPWLSLAVAAVALELWRGRDRIVLALGGATVAWWAIVVGMTWDGYPGLRRFFLPAAAMTCVLAGYGLLRVATLAAELIGGVLARLGAVGRGGLGGWVQPAVVAGAIVAILAGSVHFVSARWTLAREQEPLAALAVNRIDRLGQAVAALGGHDRILPCASSVVTVNHSLQTALAWKLGTTLERVQTVLQQPGIAFVGPRDSVDGGILPPAFKFETRTLKRVGAWSLQQVYPAGGRPGRCVGA
jgi:hypothetical protein